MDDIGTRSTARRQEHVRELCGAAVRALSGEPELHYRGERPYQGRRALPPLAPHLYPAPDDGLASFRGAADGLALRLLHCDQELHRSMAPADPTARLVFEMLEQFRVESLAPDSMPGMTDNLRHRHDQWSLGCHHAGLTATAGGLLLYTVAQICRARISGQPVTAATEGVIEAPRAALAPRLGHHLAPLRRLRADQRAFARHARALALAVGGLTASAGPAAQGAQDTGEDDDRPPPRGGLSLLTECAEAEPAGTVAPGAAGPHPAEEPPGYRVFTTAYDRQWRAGRLVRPELLTDYRSRLDREMADAHLNIPRLARELTRRLARPAPDGWDGGQEEGRIDGRMLAQLVSSPTERRLFCTERNAPVADAVVTFLIDCSGSMKEHGTFLAMLADGCARALELAGADCEILGFTTGAWHGGRARRDWLRAGRPGRPGRLNEQCHLVFKDAGTPWRSARRDIAALLRPELFREGIDGEAVDWAAGRMLRRAAEAGPGTRRLLFVLSDGSPMDTATQLANDRGLLDSHLAEVVADHEASGAVEIFGLGLGGDLGACYRRSRVLDPSRGLDQRALHEIAALIGRPPATGRAFPGS
jgi:cobaltochelatase CobT